jgi:hypothetical protein
MYSTVCTEGTWVRILLGLGTVTATLAGFEMGIGGIVIMGVFLEGV